MDINDHDDIPDWNFRRRQHDGEAWKKEPFIKRAEALYAQSREVYRYARLFCDSLEGEMAEMTEKLILENVLLIPTKIVAAEGGDMYVLRMENASIIRTQCRQIVDQVNYAEMTGIGNEDYAKVVLDEMEKFKILFIEWVSHFERDEFEDEWGLYR